ncbi:MAG: hypothetical protein QOJ59_2793 [Thermomicrobiales bacterium]|nr:hypothetical protein [Thermomicrobiales bacterium]
MFDAGRSWARIFAGAAAGAAHSAWDAIPRPRPAPGTGLFPPPPPTRPVRPEQPRTADPQASAQPTTRTRVDPIPLPMPRTRPWPSNPCTVALSQYPPSLPQDRRDHIRDRHGPELVWSARRPNGAFSRTAWAILDLLIGRTLATPPFPPTLRGTRCTFSRVPFPMRTGTNQDRNGSAWGVQVIYVAAPGDRYRPGTIVTAYPWNPLDAI